MIVVDLGCCGHGRYDSVGALVEKFNPSIVYGFDPLADDRVYSIGETVVVTRGLAAWTHDGEVPFQAAGSGSAVGEGDPVPCFNLCAWLNTLPGEVVLKMDVEGAEYTLLRNLAKTGTDERLALALVEWHGPQRRELRCPVEEWWM